MLCRLLLLTLTCKTCPNSCFRFLLQGIPQGFRNHTGTKVFILRVKIRLIRFKCQLCFTNTHQTRNNVMLYDEVKHCFKSLNIAISLLSYKQIEMSPDTGETSHAPE